MGTGSSRQWLGTGRSGGDQTAIIADQVVSGWKTAEEKDPMI